jgi:hypothetical protein
MVYFVKQKLPQLITLIMLNQPSHTLPSQLIKLTMLNQLSKLIMPHHQFKLIIPHQQFTLIMLNQPWSRQFNLQSNTQLNQPFNTQLSLL